MPRETDHPHRQHDRDDLPRPAAVCAWRAAPPTPEGSAHAPPVHPHRQHPREEQPQAGVPAIPGAQLLPRRAWRVPQSADYPHRQPGWGGFLRPAAVCAWSLPRSVGEGPMLRREQRAPSAGSSCPRGSRSVTGLSEVAAIMAPGDPPHAQHLAQPPPDEKSSMSSQAHTCSPREPPGGCAAVPRTRQCPQDPSWHPAGIGHSRCRPLLRLRLRLHAEHGQRAVPRRQEPPQEGDAPAPLSPEKSNARRIRYGIPRAIMAQSPPPATPAAPSPRRTWSACCPAQPGTAAERRCSPADRRRRGAAPRGAAPAAPRRGRPPAPASGSPG